MNLKLQNVKLEVAIILKTDTQLIKTRHANPFCGKLF